MLFSDIQAVSEWSKLLIVILQLEGLKLLSVIFWPFRMILFNYLAAAGRNSGLCAGMCVSVAWNASESTLSLEKPLNLFFFNRYLARLLVNKIREWVNNVHQPVGDHWWGMLQGVSEERTSACWWTVNNVACKCSSTFFFRNKKRKLDLDFSDFWSQSFTQWERV